jgi:hypothetical protein
VAAPLEDTVKVLWIGGTLGSAASSPDEVQQGCLHGGGGGVFETLNFGPLILANHKRGNLRVVPEMMIHEAELRRI